MKDGDIMILNYIFNRIKDKSSTGRGADAARAPVGVFLTAAENESFLKGRFLNSSDFKTRIFTFKGPGGKNEKALLAFMDGLTDSAVINDSIIKPLMHGLRNFTPASTGRKSKVERINDVLLSVGEIETAADLDTAISGILNGDCAMFVEGCTECTIISSKGFEKRGVEQPSYDISMRGPRESFNENLRTNTSLLRRRVKNSRLTFESMVVGRKTNTNLCITYIDGLADPKLIAEIKRRIGYINVDMILESGYIEEYIEDRPFSIFATMGLTERPDVLAGKLLEGRVGILIDGSPFALTAPYFFIEAFQNPEDYYARSTYASIVRIFRYLAFFLSILVPGLYVALTSYHQELIPASLLFSMSASSDGVPFNSFTETALFLLIFELLKEAGIHMPKNVGQTISIVGGLVMGEAAIQAGIIGAPVVIIIAFTAVSSFVVPMLSNEVTMLRWIFLFLGGLLGGYGISIGIICLTIHVTGIYSFGYSYFSPFFPCRPEDLKDTFLRAPLWIMRKRPAELSPDDRTREDTPIPPDNHNGG